MAGYSILSLSDIIDEKGGGFLQRNPLFFFMPSKPGRREIFDETLGN